MSARPLDLADIISKKKVEKTDTWEPDPSIPQTAKLPENLVRQYYEQASRASARMANNDDIIRRNKMSVRNVPASQLARTVKTWRTLTSDKMRQCDCHIEK